MKNIIAIIIFQIIVLHSALAQQDTIRRVKIISASEAEPVKKEEVATPAPAVVAPPTVDLTKEIENLKKEMNLLKDSKRVVVIPTQTDLSDAAVARQTIVGLNMTTMISRLVPFGNGIPLSGPTSIMLRRYRNNRAFRMGLGLNASNDATHNNATIRIGTERRKELNPSFTFIRGVDFLLAAGSFNTPGFTFAGSNSGAIGAALTFGLEYNIAKNISIGTEALIFGGISQDVSSSGGGGSGATDSGFSLKIIPPIAIYLNASLF
jgi:hypothetical protein